MTKRSIVGYSAGILSGIAYGFNPLFAKPLLAGGTSVYSMLFFRYAIAVIILGLWMGIKEKGALRLQARQIPMMIVLGLLFAGSSIGLFLSYHYIPTGLATVIVYVYPIYTAFMMLMIGKNPSWQVWTCVLTTVFGVVLMCLPHGDVHLHWAGVMCSALSALSYAVYLILINNNKTVAAIQPHAITFWSLVVGGILFLAIVACMRVPLLQGINTAKGVACVTGLAIFPTLVSLLCLTIATRRVGATRTAVMGVFEPITALLVGVLAFGETLTVSCIIGVIICMISIVFMVSTNK